LHFFCPVLSSLYIEAFSKFFGILPELYLFLKRLGLIVSPTQVCTSELTQNKFFFAKYSRNLLSLDDKLKPENEF